jgi:hypothetical protein
MNAIAKCSTLATLIVMLAAPCGAHADVIYDFTGTCTSGTSCGATTAYTGVLHLRDGFTAGSVVSPTDVISFDLQGFSMVGTGYVPSAGTNVCGLPPGPGCNSQNLGLVDLGNPGYFYSYGDGSWNLIQLGFQLPRSGTNGVWVPVNTTPLPAAGWLMLSALGGIGLLRRRCAGLTMTLPGRA